MQVSILLLLSSLLLTLPSCPQAVDSGKWFNSHANPARAPAIHAANYTSVGMLTCWHHTGLLACREDRREFVFVKSTREGQVEDRKLTKWPSNKSFSLLGVWLTQIFTLSVKQLMPNPDYKYFVYKAGTDDIWFAISVLKHTFMVHPVIVLTLWQTVLFSFSRL